MAEGGCLNVHEPPPFGPPFVWLAGLKVTPAPASAPDAVAATSAPTPIATRAPDSHLTRRILAIDNDQSLQCDIAHEGDLVDFLKVCFALLIV